MPPIHYRITQDVNNNFKRALPDVGFYIAHVGDSLPVQTLVTATVFLEHRNLGPVGGALYSGLDRWNFNPRFGLMGHFEIPVTSVEERARLEIRMDVSVIDQYERQHDLLPMSWIYMPAENAWFTHPSPEPR